MIYYQRVFGKGEMSNWLPRSEHLFFAKKKGLVIYLIDQSITKWTSFERIPIQNLYFTNPELINLLILNAEAKVSRKQVKILYWIL